jgi:hypothetical protein
MLRTLATLVAICLVGGCQRSAEEKQGDALRKVADGQARQIEQQSAAQTRSMSQQAAQLKAQAEQAGGLTGERLKVQSEALGREAAIVEKQGREKAEAVREAADAQAKANASR